MSDELIGFVIDTKLRRPACVLLQAALGGPYKSGLFGQLFGHQHWLIIMTPDMHIVRGTREQWERFAKELDSSPQCQKTKFTTTTDTP